MSVPHTGRLTAIVDGVECQFNGELWTTPVPRLTEALNQATATSPKSHFDIKDLAEHVLGKLGLLDRSRITSWSGDEWEDDLPEGTID